MEETTKQKMQRLENELNHRLEKLWRIFSWASSILISIIGGIIVLEKIEHETLHISERIIFSAVVLILTGYAFYWICQNLKFETETRKKLESLLNSSADSKPGELPHRVRWGYNPVIILLGLTALSAIWVSLLIKYS